jgi:hypothetical protein
LHIRFDNLSYNAKFGKAIEVLTNNRKIMGIREMVLDRAKKEGLEEKSFKVVENLLATGKFTIAEIANFADVSEAYVRKVKKDLK